MKPIFYGLCATLLTVFLFSCISSRNNKGFVYKSSNDALSIGQNEITPLNNPDVAGIDLPGAKAISEERKTTASANVKEELKTSRLYLQEGKLKMLAKSATQIPANATAINSMGELKEKVEKGEVKNVSEKKFKKAERFSEKMMKKKGLNDSGSPLIWAAIFLGAALVLTIVNIEIVALIALVIGLFFLVKWIINQSQ